MRLVLATWLCLSAVAAPPLFRAQNVAVDTAFSPDDLPGLALWLDADDSLTLTLSGSVVDEWRDKSGNGRHFAGSGSARPALVSAAYNGRDAIQFDGVNDALTLGANGMGRNVGAVTAYAVMKWRTGTPTAGSLYMHIAAGVSLASGRIVLYTDGSTYAAGGRRLDADAFQAVTGSTVNTSYRSMVQVFDYTNSDLNQYIDGSVSGSTASFQTAGSTSNTDSLGAAIGARSDSAAAWANIEISEILVYHAAHDAATRAQVEAYLTR